MLFLKHFLNFKWKIIGNQRISWEVEGIIDFKLVRNKHKYELVCQEMNLKKFINVSHSRDIPF